MDAPQPFNLYGLANSGGALNIRKYRRSSAAKRRF